MARRNNEASVSHVAAAARDLQHLSLQLRSRSADSSCSRFQLRSAGGSCPADRFHRRVTDAPLWWKWRRTARVPRRFHRLPLRRIARRWSASGSGRKYPASRRGPNVISSALSLNSPTISAAGYPDSNHCSSRALGGVVARWRQHRRTVQGCVEGHAAALYHRLIVEA